MCMKQILCLCLVLAIVLLFTACKTDVSVSSSSGTNKNLSGSSLTLSDRYVAPQTTNVISLTGSSATFNGSTGVQIKDSLITISEPGTYTVEGELTDGQLVVNTSAKGTVNLVLNGVSITNNSSAAIYIAQAQEAVISLVDETQNTLNDAKKYQFAEGEDEPKACLFSKDDLVICGNGKLTVNGNYNNAIQSKDTLTLENGNYQITAENNGVVGKDDVTIGNGTYSITAQNDAIKSTNDTDAALGTVTILGGTFQLDTGGDGVQAQTVLTIYDGNFTITTGGGAQNAAVHTQNDMFGKGGGMRGERPDGVPGGMPGGMPMEQQPGNMPAIGEKPDEVAGATQKNEAGTTANQTAMSQLAKENQPQDSTAFHTAATNENQSASATADETSMKALKGSGGVVVYGGNFTINSCDDAVHSNAYLIIEAGVFQIATGDDAFHADNTLTINDGTIDITQSYEGLEGYMINITGGNIAIVASDDGINVAGGDGSGQFGFAKDNVSASADSILTGDTYLHITGGTLTINASGDGIDINGSGVIDGGAIEVQGPNSGGDSALDYDGTLLVNGGTLCAVGSSQMAMALGSGSSQPSLSVYASVNAGQTVSIKKSDGTVLYAVTVEKQVQHLVFSSDLLPTGETVIVTADNTAVGEITLTAGVNTIGQAAAGGLGQGGKGQGGFRPR